MGDEPSVGTRFVWGVELRDSSRGGEVSIVTALRRHKKRGHIISVTWRYESDTASSPSRACLISTYMRHAEPAASTQGDRNGP